MITTNKDFFHKFISYYLIRLIPSILIISSITYYQLTHHLIYLADNIEKYLFFGKITLNILMFPFSCYGLSYLYLKVTKKSFRYIRPWEIQILTRRIPLHTLITIIYTVISFGILFMIIEFSYIIGIPALIFFIISAIKSKMDL
ncbi:hypothetical protein EB16_02765 [Enterococcus faecium]|nr:hypothetical protein EB16_02765 [Enterococcus faecium]